MSYNNRNNALTDTATAGAAGAVIGSLLAGIPGLIIGGLALGAAVLSSGSGQSRR